MNGHFGSSPSAGASAGPAVSAMSRPAAPAGRQRRHAIRQLRVALAALAALAACLAGAPAVPFASPRQRAPIGSRAALRAAQVAVVSALDQEEEIVEGEDRAVTVLVCVGKDCLGDGASDVLKAIRKARPRGAKVKSCNCLGPCGNGPVVLAAPPLPGAPGKEVPPWKAVNKPGGMRITGVSGVCVCIHICIDIYIYIYTHTHIHYIYIYIYIYIERERTIVTVTCICLYVYIYTGPEGLGQLSAWGFEAVDISLCFFGISIAMIVIIVIATNCLY